MARASSGTKFASVNLNKSYGKPASNQNAGAGAGSGGTAAGLGLSQGAGRSRLGSASTSSHGGMLLLTRPGAAAPKSSKLAVPLPVNLPSLRREHAGNDPTIALVGGGVGGPGWSKQQHSEEVEAESGPGSAPSPAAAAALSRPQPQGGSGARSAVYAPPGTRPLQRSGASTAVALQAAEKAVLLRGEDFPTLQATLPLRPPSPQRQKQHKHQDTQAIRSGQKQQENGERAPQDRRAAPAREPFVPSQRERPGRQEGVPQSLAQPPSAGAHGGSIQSSSISSRPGAREDGYGSGPPPFLGVSRSSNWTDDEREPGARPSSTGHVEFASHAERDFYRDQLHQGDYRPFYGREGRGFGPSSGNGIGKDENRSGNIGAYGRDTREVFGRGPQREAGDSRDRGPVRERSDVRELAFGRALGAVAEESVGVHRGFVREAEVTRENGVGSEREKFWGKHPGTERDSFAGKDRPGVRFSPGYGHVREGRDSFFQGGRTAGSDRSGPSLYTGNDDALRGRYDTIGGNVFPSGRGMHGFDHGRGKQAGLTYGQPFVDEPVVGDLTIPGFDFLSAGGDSRNRGPHKRRELAEEVYHDPERDSFEAELERVQRQQEHDRLQKIEEKERAVLQAKKEEEEQKRLALEEEEKRIKQEQEAREAQAQAEQQALEAAQKAAQEKLAREEEKKQRQLEEDRRLENARRKLLELEDRIAQRERERLAEQNRHADVGNENSGPTTSQTSGPAASQIDKGGRYKDGRPIDGDQMISRSSVELIGDKEDHSSSGPGHGVVISPMHLRYAGSDSNLPVSANESAPTETGRESLHRMVSDNRVGTFSEVDRSDPCVWRNDHMDSGHWTASLSQVGRASSDGSGDLQRLPVGELSSGPRHFVDKDLSPRLGTYNYSGRIHGERVVTKELEDPQTRRWAAPDGLPQSKHLYPRSGTSNYDSFLRSSSENEGVRRWGRDKSERARSKDGIQRLPPAISSPLPEPEPDFVVGRLRHFVKQPHVLPPPSKASLQSFHPKITDAVVHHVVEPISREQSQEGPSFKKSYVSVSGHKGPAERLGAEERPVEPSGVEESSSQLSPWESLFSQQDKKPQHGERSGSPSLRPHGTFGQAFRPRGEHFDKRHQQVSEDQAVSGLNNVSESSSLTVKEGDKQGVASEGVVGTSFDNTSDDDLSSDKLQVVEEVQTKHLGGKDSQSEDNRSAPSIESDKDTNNLQGGTIQLHPRDDSNTGVIDNKVEAKVNGKQALAQLLDSELGGSYVSQESKEQKQQDNAPGQQASEKNWQAEQAVQDTEKPCHSSAAATAVVSSNELHNLKQPDAPLQLLPSSSTALPQSVIGGAVKTQEPMFTQVVAKDDVLLQVGLRPSTQISSVSGAAIHIGSIPMPLHPFAQLGLNTVQPPLFQFGQLGDISSELPRIEKHASFRNPPSPQQRQSPVVQLAENRLFGSDVFESGQVGKSLPLEPSESPWMAEYASPVDTTRSSDVEVRKNKKQGLEQEQDAYVPSVVSQPSHLRDVGEEHFEPASESVDVISSSCNITIAELDVSSFNGEGADSRWRSAQGRGRQMPLRSAGTVGRGRGRNNVSTETTGQSDVSLFGTVPLDTRSDGMGLKNRSNRSRHRRKVEVKGRESGTSGDRDYFSAYDSNMQQERAHAVDTVKPSWFPSGESGVRKDRSKEPWMQSTEKKSSISSRQMHPGSASAFPQRSRKSDRPGTGTSDGLLGKYGSSDGASDLPLHNGSTHVLQQPVLSAPTDEDDFIEVRSKRQMLNDKREQREREKAKTFDTKTKDHMVRKSRSGLKPGSVGDSSSGHAGKASSSGVKERRLPSSLPFGQRQLEPVPMSSTFATARSVATSSVPGSNRLDGESISVSTHEAQLKGQQSVPATTITWGNVRSTLEVVGLHEDAKKPAASEVSMHSKIPGGDRGTAVVESSLSISVSSAEDKVSATVPSLFGLFSAGDNIQFGAVIPPSLLIPSSHILTPSVSSASSALGFRLDGPGNGDEQGVQKSGAEDDVVSFSARGKRARSDTMIIDVVEAGVGTDSGSGADAEAEAEAEAEAAASAVAVAAISADEPFMQSCHGDAQGAVSGPATGNKGSYRQTVSAPGSIGLAMGVQRLVQAPMPEDPVSVALPSDLSVETSTLLRGTAPSQGPAVQVFPSMSGGQSPFPGSEVGSMLGGPVFGFQPGEEVVSAPRQGQDSSVRDHGVGSMGAGVGGWRQHVGVVDSLYGTPPSSFSGAGAFMNSGIPNLQAAPHMLVYTNPFAPLNQFGQLGFMGPTYLPSGKQPDWKHTPVLSSNTGVVGMSSEVGGLVSQHNSGMSGAEVQLQSQWSHVPGLPLHSAHLPSSLLGFSLQPRNPRNPHSSMDLLPPNNMEGISSLGSAGSKGPPSNGPLRFVDAAVARFPDELGLGDLVSSHMAEAPPAFHELKSPTSVGPGMGQNRMPRSRRPARVARGGDVRSAGLNGNMKGTNGILGPTSGQRTVGGQAVPPERHNLGPNEQLSFGQAIGVADRSGVISPGSAPKTGAKGAGWNGQAARKPQGAGKQPSFGSAQGEKVSTSTSRLKQVYVVKPSVPPPKRVAAANGTDPSGRASIFTPNVGSQEGDALSR